MKHIFDVEIATKYGIVPAILLENILFWVKKNEANRKNFEDGKYWTYNSVKAFSELFPYMTEKQIRLGLELLIKNGLLEKCSYNKRNYDRTNWYTITDIGYSELNCSIYDIKLCDEGLMESPSKANVESPSTANVESPSMANVESPSKANGVDVQGETIPDINNIYKNTYKKPNIKIIAEEEFRELSDSKSSKRNYTATTPREDVIEDNKQTREDKVLGIIHKSDLEKSIQDALVTFYYNCIAKVERKGIKITSETTKYNLSPDRVSNIIANIKLQMQMHKYTDKDILESVLFSGDNGYAKIVFPHERFSSKPKNESHTGNNTKVVYTKEELDKADEEGRKLEEQMKKDGTWREYY